MERFKDPEALAQFLDKQRDNEGLMAAKPGLEGLGFVPTMGALHAGHTSLVNCSVSQCQRTLVSIFVNPTQFDRAEDLAVYPRHEDDDLALLAPTGCDAVWMPSVQDLYPGGAAVSEHWNFAGLDQGMEGEHRSGHFAGVAQVVVLLLRTIKPDVLYLGQKDYQQCRILEHVIEQEGLPVRVQVCPIVRESDGLAMSSRNLLLDAAPRQNAVALSRTLFAARAMARTSSPQQVVAFARRALTDAHGLDLGYAELVHSKTLEPLESWPDDAPAVLCAAAWAGSVRLIDNVLVTQEDRA